MYMYNTVYIYILRRGSARLRCSRDGSQDKTGETCCCIARYQKEQTLELVLSERLGA